MAIKLAQIIQQDRHADVPFGRTEAQPVLIIMSAGDAALFVECDSPKHVSAYLYSRNSRTPETAKLPIAATLGVAPSVRAFVLPKLDENITYTLKISEWISSSKNDLKQSVFTIKVNRSMIIGACAAADVHQDFAWPLMQPLGLQVARCWYGFGGFMNAAANRNIDRQCDFAEATGVDLFWTFGQEGLHPDQATPEWVDAYARIAARNLRDQYDARPKLKGKKIRGAIGNECNLIHDIKDGNGKIIGWEAPYWKHKSKDGYIRSKAFIDLVQRRVYNVFKDELGDRCELGSMEYSWDYGTMERLADYVQDYSDFDTFHPYTNGHEINKIRQPVKTAHSRGRKLVMPELMANCGPRLRAGKMSLNSAMAEALWLLSTCEQEGVDEVHLFTCYDQDTSNSWSAQLKRETDSKNRTIGVEKGPGYSLLAHFARKAA